MKVCKPTAALQILASKIIQSVPGTAARNSVVASTQHLEPLGKLRLWALCHRRLMNLQFCLISNVDLSDLTFDIDDFSCLGSF